MPAVEAQHAARAHRVPHLIPRLLFGSAAPLNAGGIGCINV